MANNDSDLPEGDTSSNLMLSFLPTKEEEERKLSLADLTVVTTASNYASDMPFVQCSHSLQMGHDNIADWLQFLMEVPSPSPPSSSSFADEPFQSPPSFLVHDPTMEESAAKAIAIGTDSRGRSAIPLESIPSACQRHIATQEMIALPSSVPMVDLECHSKAIVGGCTTLQNNNNSNNNHALKLTKSEGALIRDTNINMTVDGYKWRKYGKKALKHSSYERNYYACSTMKCPARKYMDCCITTKFTLTSYEGTHSHPSPI